MTFLETVGICVITYIVFSFIKIKFSDSIAKDEYEWNRYSRGEWFSGQLEINLNEISTTFHGMQKYNIENYEYPYNEIIQCHKIHIYAVSKLHDLDDHIVLWVEGIIDCFFSVSDKLEHLKNNSSLNNNSNIEDLIQDDEYWQHLNSEFERYENEIRKVIEKLSKYNK